MARQRPIRIMEKDRKEYNRLVRNTKAKIRRTRQNHGIDLTSEVNIRPLESFQTRKAFNEWKEEQKSFTNPANQRYQFVTNKYGFTASKREITQMQQLNRRAQRKSDRLVKELSKLPRMRDAEKKGTVAERVIQIGKSNATGITKPPKFDVESIQSRAHFERKREALEERLEPGYYADRAETMKANYIQKLLETFNSDAREVADKIAEMDTTDFYELYVMNKDEIDFDYLYMDDSQKNRDFVNKIGNTVNAYESGNINMDLKGF